MLKKTGIVVDSTSYLDEEYIKKHNIKVVPLSINVGEKNYEEGFCGSYDNIFDSIKDNNGILKTSQPPFGKFIEAYKELFDEGVEQILTICLSSGLSGTSNGAVLATTNFSDKNIKVIDSFTAAGVLKKVIEETVEILKEQDDLNCIENIIKEKVENSSIDLTVMDLEYLKRGGRLTNSQAIIGNLLKIKPIISLTDGCLILTEKTRGTKKAVKTMMDKIKQTGKNPRKISIGYVKEKEKIIDIKEELEKSFPEAEITLDEIGPVIGGHLGPGSFGICTLYD